MTRLDESGLVIEIADDGRGVAWDAIRRRGEAAGLPVATAQDLVHCLFGLGVSTKEEATLESGRGIGLSVLRRATDEMGGDIGVESAAGRGTTMSFRFSAEAVTRLGPNRVSSTTIRISTVAPAADTGKHVA